MPTLRRTYAGFLLIIFSIVTFHDLMPHAHHLHEGVDASTAHHHDHHEDHDHASAGLLSTIGHLLHLHEHEHSDCEIDICADLSALKQGQRTGKTSANAWALVIRTDAQKLDLKCSILQRIDTPIRLERTFTRPLVPRGPPPAAGSIA